MCDRQHNGQLASEPQETNSEVIWSLREKAVGGEAIRNRDITGASKVLGQVGGHAPGFPPCQMPTFSVKIQRIELVHHGRSIYQSGYVS